MVKLGFVVGHPTQFEAPFFRFVTNLNQRKNLSVYYYNYQNGLITDRELGKDSQRSWGIDLISGYSWTSIIKQPLAEALKVLRENQYVIVNGYTTALSVFIILLSPWFGRKVGLRLDTVPWNNRGFVKRFLKGVWINLLAIFVDVFWGTSSQTKRFLLGNGIAPKRIKRFSYIIDNEWFEEGSIISLQEKERIKRELGISPGHRVILAIVKLVKRESPEDIIRAFGLTGIQDISLIIVGDGELRMELEKNAKIWAEEKEVLFTGYIPYPVLPRYYGISDVYVHTSENEPWGVSVQEAIACGLPVIASNFVGSAYDLIREGNNGMIYQHADIENLSQCISSVLGYNMQDVRKVNQDILKEWNYQVLWDEIERHIDSRET